MTDQDANDIRVVSNLPTGFSVGPPLATDTGPRDIESGDLNGDGLGDMGRDLGLIARWVCASVLLAEVREQQFVVSCALGALDVVTASTDGDLTLPSLRKAAMARRSFRR